ncbi:hypothetical protein CLOSTMETH_01268 [[Clostridium] methylpentosum DSM 5476]|uniref:Uncharacterized protein n=1 Tax=[Clostridium] methylpentosum DSM 5476 TaxID=537013 RepID=C0EBQ0_9FIRM|nr:hypothetical protein CLOSTMETH_01268 [[Clostridium] methylpentosum DSM 5476]
MPFFIVRFCLIKPLVLPEVERKSERFVKERKVLPSKSSIDSHRNRSVQMAGEFEPFTGCRV